MHILKVFVTLNFVIIISALNTVTTMKEVNLPIPPTLIESRELLTVWLILNDFFSKYLLENVKLAGASWIIFVYINKATLNRVIRQVGLLKILIVEIKERVKRLFISYCINWSLRRYGIVYQALHAHRLLFSIINIQNMSS